MKKRITISSCLLLVCILLSFFIYSGTKKEYVINKTLKNKYYSYLPKEAKAYIKDVYEETGKIIDTEKNKQENVPYLSPKYVEYLALSEEEKKEVEEIPQVYAINFKTEETPEELPATYDLRNVEGNNYITPLKNQETLGICWDFTTVEQVESNLMVKNNQPYNNLTPIFSVRQIDYASSTNGIKDYENELGFRELTSGGNFLTSSMILYNGLGLHNNVLMPFNTSTEQKELSEVLNYNKSLYELNSSVLMPTMTKTSTPEEWENYKNTLKQLIIENGGAYAGTQAPGYSCSSRNPLNNTTIIRVDDVCEEDGNHAMQIIGWDDNYEYSYCQTQCTDKNVPCHSGNVSTCASSNLVTGKGAWLLRNSWGNSEAYIYLAYDSVKDDIYVFTDLSSTENKTWDNNYHKKMSEYVTNNNSITFTKEESNSEKLQKVKFFSYVKNGTFTISITSGNNNYNNVKEVTIPNPGIYTVDLSDQNIILDNANFTVRVSGNYLIKDSIAVFTSNVSTEPLITTKLEEDNITLEASNNGYSFRLLSNTKNIESNSQINYSLKDCKGNDESNYLTVQNNIVAINNVNALINISSGIKQGYHTLTISYQNTSEDIQLLIGEPSANIYFYANDGTENLVVQNVNLLNPIILQANTFNRVGYTFDKWTTNADGTGDNYTNSQLIETMDDDLTLYAQWIPNTYTVTFNANGGTGEMNQQQFTYGVNQTLQANTFTHEQYEFVSWNTKADGTGTFYQDGQLINNLTSAENGQITLYAMWNKTPDVYYKTHVQSYGWQDYVKNGIMSGTSGEGKRLEAIQIKLQNMAYAGNIEYKTHIQTYGWEQEFRKNNQISGTSGEAKRLEAIQIRLTDQLEEHYDIYYRVHAQTFGWLGWAKNGESAGTASFAYRLEAIQIKIVEKGSSFPEYSAKEAFKQKYVEYSTHIQSYGWQEYAYDGNMSGTEGEAKRLEAIRIKLSNQKYMGDIEYRTHIQSYDWEPSFKKNDQISGTSGEAKRLEAIQINLTGKMAEHYDVYYRVHAQKFGWMNWAKNGEKAGTAGYAYRLEGIEIVLVEKGQQPPQRTNQNNSKAYIENK